MTSCDVIRHTSERITCATLTLAAWRERLIHLSLRGVEYRFEKWVLRHRLKCGANSHSPRIGYIALKIQLEDAGDLVLVSEKGAGQETLRHSLWDLTAARLGDSPLEQGPQPCFHFSGAR